MGIKAVLFDLDGTLLPMNQEKFTKGYFKELSSVLSPLGVAPKLLVDAVWDGTKAMIKNDGQKQNVEVFWERFANVTQMNIENFRTASDRFYINEFNNVRALTGENPLALTALEIAHQKDRKVVLATNPIFPLDGQKSRLSWIGLKAEDFELVTSYESDSFCKPNPQYYFSICERIGISPEECIMIGNDETEDMYAATKAGMSAYLVTDCRIESQTYPWQGNRGTFSEMIEMLKQI